MRDIFISAKFLSDDRVPFVVDNLNRVWIIRRLFDADGIELDTVEGAVTAEVTCSEHLISGTAYLHDMTEPRIN